MYIKAYLEINIQLEQTEAHYMNFGFLAGPLVGSVIGYFTNYLAVKMLFHPRQEIKIFGHTLPFTPGVIPKGKPRLAKAIGGVIGTTLLTKEDITNKLLSEDIKETLSNRIMELFCQDIKTELSTLSNADEETYEKKKEKLVSIISEQIMVSLSELQIGKIIADEGAKAIKEKVKGTFLAMMVSDDLINSIAAPMGEKIQQYIEENGNSYIQPILFKKATQIEQSSVIELLEGMDIEQNTVKKAIVSAYEKIVTENVEKLFEHFDIAQIVEDKINEMDVEELENLVLSVMKNELDTIVNLGAVIGFLIGIINIFI